MALDHFKGVRRGDAPHCRSVSGYGRKLPTGYKVMLWGENRWRRVYACRYGNAATLYVVKRGQWLIVELT